MVRLIDADELRHSHCVECTLYPDKCLEKDCDWGSIYHIDHAPTVEAIPISWLENFRDGLDTLSESQLMRAIDLIIDAYRTEKKREENEKTGS